MIEEIQLETISCLIDQLASPLGNEAEEAKYILQNYGIAAIPAVLYAIPTLDHFSQLYAIEIIESCSVEELRRIEHPSVANTLIPLLKSENEVVREWSARTLGWLEARNAIPALCQAQQTAKEGSIPPDWSERVALRYALTKLGVRETVMPISAACRALSTDLFDTCWVASDLEHVIKVLAEMRQVILYFQLWTKRNGCCSWREGWSNDTSLNEPWDDIVAQSAHRALMAAANITHRDNAIVTIEWINENDI